MARRRARWLEVAIAPAGLPRPVQVLIERRHRDVEDQRGQDPSLQGAGMGVLVIAEIGEDPGLEEHLDQREHALVLDPGPHPFHDGEQLSKAASMSASSTHRYRLVPNT